MKMLGSRVPLQALRVQLVATDSWRSQKESSAQRGYGAKWRRARLQFLARNPLCVMCERAGITEAATVVDHKVPHRGDETLFWDETNWQPLCATHHSSDKQREEHGMGSQLP